MSEREILIAETCEKLQEAIKNFIEIFKTVWDEIKAVLEDIEHIEIQKQIWHVPMNLGSKSQVINRKPLMVVARSCC